jgi:hypothetical protein
MSTHSSQKVSSSEVRPTHSGRPKYLITIDTEGDNQWSRSETITTNNSAFLPRFQTICEKYGLKPTYLTNYEMAICPVYRDFARDLLARGTGEVGMHLHSWNNPPIVPRTEDDFKHHPYLMEFSEPLIREKVAVMTDLLEDTFGGPIVSHRAGRWGFNDVYARVLIDRGYLVDCSVTPRVSWRSSAGAPDGLGGPDFRSFSDKAYYLDPHDISRAGRSTLLEVPMTIHGPSGRFGSKFHKLTTGKPKPFRVLANRLFPPINWLRPNGSNLNSMLRVQREVIESKADYAEFMLHSSEFMPGGSPSFPTNRDIERLYEHLEILFENASRFFDGATLNEFHQSYAESHPSNLD